MGDNRVDRGRQAGLDHKNDPARQLASWYGNRSHEIPSWNRPTPGHMTAVLLGTDHAEFVEIDRADPREDLARLLGTDEVARTGFQRHIEFWLGPQYRTTAPLNAGATEFVQRLLEDVAAGAYIASDRDRDTALLILGSRLTLAIHGPCVITGSAAATTPSPLNPNFEDWVATPGEDRGQMHSELMRGITASTARAC